MRELKEHLDRVMLEGAKKEQTLQAVMKERDRLVRENQTKVRKKCMCSETTCIHAPEIT